MYEASPGIASVSEKPIKNLRMKTFSIAQHHIEVPRTFVHSDADRNLLLRRHNHAASVRNDFRERILGEACLTNSARYVCFTGLCDFRMERRTTAGEVGEASRTNF